MDYRVEIIHRPVLMPNTNLYGMSSLIHPNPRVRNEMRPEHGQILSGPLHNRGQSKRRHLKRIKKLTDLNRFEYEKEKAIKKKRLEKHQRKRIKMIPNSSFKPPNDNALAET